MKDRIETENNKPSLGTELKLEQYLVKARFLYLKLSNLYQVTDIKASGNHMTHGTTQRRFGTCNQPSE